jgi:microcompartment protein CcmK/EutM
MTLAKVIGTVVSSHKPQKMDGLKYLLLESIDASTMKGKNSYVVAMDSVGAGYGEIVFYVTGSSARMTDVTQGRPTDATVIAIVDLIEKDGSFVYKKDE